MDPRIGNTLLIAPPYQAVVASIAQTTVGAPMGIAYLASALLAADESVQLIDANAEQLGVAELVARIVAIAPEVIGFTATTPTVGIAAEVAMLTRQAGFSGPILVGGPHASALPAQTLETWPCFNVAVVGEAEERIVPLVRLLRDGASLEPIAGLAWREDGDIRQTELPEVPDVDALLPPARSLLPMHLYRSPDSLHAQTVVATRGCPAPCTYCAVPGMFGKQVRRRSPARVADEIEVLVDRWGCDHVNFVDDTFTWDARWVEDLCAELLRRGLHRKLRWQCLTRVDRVGEPLLQLMALAGCMRVELGIECASPDGLRALHKGIRADQVAAAFAAARRAGLETMALAMVNAPGEGLAEVEQTWRLIRQIDPDQLQVSICTPYPGTLLYESASRDGLLRTEDFSRFRFLRQAVFDNGEMSEEQALHAQRLLQRRFWLRPTTVGRLLRRSIRHPSRGLAVVRTALETLPRLMGGAALLPGLLLVTAMAPTGCSGGGDNDDDYGREPYRYCDLEERSDPFQAGMHETGALGRIQVRLDSARPSPPDVGANEWEVAVTDLVEDRGVVGCSFTINPWMPDHGHGGEPGGAVSGDTDGDYLLIGMFFPMAGYWETTLSLDCPDMEPDEVTFGLCLEG